MNRKKPRTTELSTNLKAALEEYKPNLVRDTEEAYKLKEVIDSLPEVDKIVFLLYTELQSFSQLAKRLGVSRSTCFWTVRRIREDIIKKLENDT